MNKKIIWIINQYASTLDTGFGGRHYYFAKELARNGFDVHLFSSATHHLLRKRPALSGDITVERVDGFSYVWLGGLDYAGAHDKRRILSEFSFSRKLSKLADDYDGKAPDAIVYSSPSLIPFSGALSLAKRLGVKITLDVRDIWPLTLMEMGYSRFHPLVMYLRYLEVKAYKGADFITSNWPYANRHMAKDMHDPACFAWIPNGFSMEEFESRQPLGVDAFKNFPEGKFVVGYSGTLGKANAMDTLLKAAKILKPFKDIAIVIVGSGKDKEQLRKEIQADNLSNVFLCDSVDKKQIPSLLAMFDVCYVGFLNIPLYRYGSSLTKLPEYLASARPIVYASSSPFQPVAEANAGITVEAENSDAVAAAILQLYNMPIEQRKQLGENGRKAASEQYEYKMLAKRLVEVIF